jgi:fructokinase
LSRVFVVVGEALVDLVGQRGGRTFVAHPGGSPANVALALGRLGNTVTLLTRLGADAFGEMLRWLHSDRSDADVAPGVGARRSGPGGGDPRRGPRSTSTRP